VAKTVENLLALNTEMKSMTDKVKDKKSKTKSKEEKQAEKVSRAEKKAREKAVSKARKIEKKARKASKKAKKMAKKNLKKREKKQTIIKYERQMEREDAVTYFTSLVSGLKKGAIQFKQGKDAVVITPSDLVDVEIKAQTKGRREKVMFEISWLSTKNQGISISSG
jgi:amphi-Trp domain-containing protein